MFLRNRVVAAVGKQLRCPENGFLGWNVKRILKKKNTFLEVNAVAHCEIEKDDKVLEVGFGTGEGLKAAVKLVQGGSGCIYGADLSTSCVNDAFKCFRHEIDSGKMEVIFADVKSLPFNSHYFDKIFHVNSYYFWPDTLMGCAELFRCLKPGGKVVTTLNLDSIKIAKTKGYLQGSNTDFIHYMHSLEASGFGDVKIEYLRDETVGQDYQCISATTPKQDGMAT